MESQSYRVILDVTVFSGEALCDAAVKYAMDDGAGMSEADALALLKPEGEVDVPACLQMLLDPGVSPAGTSIEQSYCESGE